MNQKTLKWGASFLLGIWSIIIIIFIALLILCALIFNDIFINHKILKMRAVLLNMFMFLNHTHALSVLLELFVKRGQQAKLLNLFGRLDLLLRQRWNMHVDCKKLKLICLQIICVWLCEIFALLTIDVLHFIQTKDTHVIFFILFFVPSYILSKLSYAYFLILVVIIQENIEVLNKYLISVTKQNGYYVCENMNCFQNGRENRERNYLGVNKISIDPQTVLFIKQTYSEIWEATEIIKNLIYFSLPVGLSNDVFVLVFNCFWFFTSLLQNANAITFYLFPLILMASNFGNMIFIAHNCSTAVETVSKNENVQVQALSMHNEIIIKTAINFVHFKAQVLQENFHRIPINVSEQTLKSLVS